MPPFVVPSSVEIPSLPERADRRVGRQRAVVVQLQAQAGGDLDARTLWLRAGVARTIVNQLIKSSPVLTPVVSPRPPPAAQRARLIGAGAR